MRDHNDGHDADDHLPDLDYYSTRYQHDDHREQPDPDDYFVHLSDLLGAAWSLRRLLL